MCVKNIIYIITFGVGIYFETYLQEFRTRILQKIKTLSAQLYVILKYTAHINPSPS